jgi:hypothetical protein
LKSGRKMTSQGGVKCSIPKKPAAKMGLKEALSL